MVVAPQHVTRAFADSGQIEQLEHLTEVHATFRWSRGLPGHKELPTRCFIHAIRKKEHAMKLRPGTREAELVGK